MRALRQARLGDAGVGVEGRKRGERYNTVYTRWAVRAEGCSDPLSEMG